MMHLSSILPLALLSSTVSALDTRQIDNNAKLCRVINNVIIQARALAPVKAYCSSLPDNAVATVTLPATTVAVATSTSYLSTVTVTAAPVSRAAQLSQRAAQEHESGLRNVVEQVIDPALLRAFDDGDGVAEVCRCLGVRPTTTVSLPVSTSTSIVTIGAVTVTVGRVDMPTTVATMPSWSPSATGSANSTTSHSTSTSRTRACSTRWSTTSALTSTSTTSSHTATSVSPIGTSPASTTTSLVGTTVSSSISLPETSIASTSTISSASTTSSLAETTTGSTSISPSASTSSSSADTTTEGTSTTSSASTTSSLADTTTESTSTTSSASTTSSLADTTTESTSTTSSASTTSSLADTTTEITSTTSSASTTLSSSVPVATGACGDLAGTRYVLRTFNTGDTTVDGNFAQLQAAFGSGYRTTFSATRQTAQEFAFQADCSLVTADTNLLTMVGGDANLHYVYSFPSVAEASELINVNWEALTCRANFDNTLTCSAMGRSIFQVTPGDPLLQLGDQNYGEAVTINLVPVPGTIFRTGQGVES